MEAPKPTVAYLGPSGTYSHQAAYDRFGSDVAYAEQRTIADVFHAVASIGAIGVVPQENTIFGAVVETYDALARAKQVFARGAVTLPVQHCLLVKGSARLGDIQTVISHEQALGQCREFLREHLPKARLVGAASTAAAARDVLAGSSTSAAIGSKLCATTFPGLTVLAEGIQTESTNFTRFYVITQGQTSPLPGSASPKGHEECALLAITPAMGKGRASISLIVAALSVDIVRMDRRPTPDGPPFQDTYVLETTSSQNMDWQTKVEDALARARRLGAEARLLGLW